MDMQFKSEFEQQWKKYFPQAELPITFFYSENERGIERAKPATGHRCLICDLAKVRNGKPLGFAERDIGCTGGKRYSGFSQELRPNFEYFLSCGIEGELEGERYVKTPEMVGERLKQQPPFDAPSKYIIFKRWDALTETDEPLVAIFFASPDVLSGLFTLTNYDDMRLDTVIAPFGAGCSSIIHWPLHEASTDNPRGVIGMFDVSARPCVPADVLTFAVPIARLQQMTGNMDESFLITDSWKKVRTRIGARA
ncbi:MAG TPA: DUF169 domain-containing protein [candidate division Zixibacteria bacterium]|nr:DUF169 domain-containing protein [candidate division Zixibacteria bacterium]